MRSKQHLGGWLALLGAAVGIVGAFVIFLNWYGPALTAEAAEPGCEILLMYTMPLLSDLCILGGVLYAVSAYGFFTAAGWAFPLVVIANVLSLQGGWFINVPFMAAGMPPVYFAIFFPNLLLFFLFTKSVGRLSWSRTLLALFSGMAFVFSFMNGVASTSRIITIGTPLFVLVQRLHWVAMVGLGVVTVGVILRPHEWMRVVGLTAGLLEVVVGVPLAIATAIDMGRFSMFAIGPIVSLLLVVVFARPTLWQRFTASDEEWPAAQPA